MVDQRVVQHALTAVKKGYRFVAKRHVHAGWVFALLGFTVAFAATILYVSNNEGRFNESQATDDAHAVLAEPVVTPDYYVAVSSGAQTNVVRWDPEYTRIPKDSNIKAIMAAVTMLVAMVAPVVLPALGIEGLGATITSGISSATGLTTETVTTLMYIVRGVSTINTAAGLVSNVPTYAIPQGLGWGAVVTPVATTKALNPATSTLIAAAKSRGKGVSVPDVDSVKVGNRAIAEINKKANEHLVKLNSLVCGKPVYKLLEDNDQKFDMRQSITQLKESSAKHINDFKSGRINGKRNEVRAIYTIAAVSAATLEGLTDMGKQLFTAKVMKQRCPTGEGTLVTDAIAPLRAQSIKNAAMAQVKTIVDNELGLMAKTARETYSASDNRLALDFERVGIKDAAILNGIGSDPLPGSAWVGFKNGDVHGKAAQDNTLMVALDKFTLSALPIRAFIGIRSTDSPVEVRLNGVPARALPEKLNQKNSQPYKTQVFELGDLTGIGTNRLSVSTVQSAGARAKFGINYVLYVVCEPGVSCLGTTQ